MRLSVTLWALALSLGACAHTAEAPRQATAQFEYRSPSGQPALLDLSNNTLSYPGGVIQFADCSDESSVCLVSPEAKIVVPRTCPDERSIEAYIKEDPTDLSFIGFEGLSGNIFRRFSPTDRFGYAFHPSNGIVKLIIIPTSGGKAISDRPSPVIEFLYQITSRQRPLACRQAQRRR